MEDYDFNFKITIVGLGLIGGSYAMALRKLGPLQITAIDMDDDALDEALDMGIIDAGYKDGKVALRDADLVIIALYPEQTIKFVQDNIDNFKKDAVITDTCGVKMQLVEKINSFLPPYLDFVAAHPMAGRESQGLKAASEEIFNNANYIITPNERNKEENIKLVDKMARAIGCKNVVYITPEEHDKIISFTSQLPHVIAVSLMTCHTEEDNIGVFTGGSFKDATRVAVINSALWSELFKLNSDNLVEEIEKFQQSMEEIKNAIKAKDMDTLNSVFNNATAKRRKMI
ncbi:prephenate dehydrogenase [Clostridium sp. DJ247]|uniref:prephenate dehydrogenase n=1 Tax=Clostridium sp. DJ247 TaxID=2726188 RepID=UPI00162A7B2D|nr:prephenate dehydrogenase [Clostridium sp. DJ247]MBC2582018.1 prephenate dehydrogenase [Clostridium sp. DJ247]